MSIYLGERTPEHALEISLDRVKSLRGVTAVSAEWKGKSWIATTVRSNANSEELVYFWCVSPRPDGDKAYFKRPGRLQRKITSNEARKILGNGSKSSLLQGEAPTVR